MTKKDYIVIASAIYNLFLGHTDWNRRLEQVANGIADALERENTRFDREKFIKACTEKE